MNRSRVASCVTATAALLVLTCGCTFQNEGTEPASVGSSGPSINGDPLADAAPGATVTAPPEMGLDAPDLEGHSVGLVTGPEGIDSGLTAEVEALLTEAEVHRLELHDDLADDAELYELIDAPVDLIVVPGPEIPSAVDFVSAAVLDTPFLLFGGQIAEPTDNVTTVLFDQAGPGQALGVGIEAALGDARSDLVYVLD